MMEKDILHYLFTRDIKKINCNILNFNSKPTFYVDVIFIHFFIIPHKKHSKR